MFNLIFCKEDCHRSVQRLNQEKNPATISQMKEQVKENIELISAEILQRIIE